MKKEVENLKDIKLLICKYIFIIIFFMSLIIYTEKSVFSIFLTLFVLISSNIRIFYIKSKEIRINMMVLEVLAMGILSIVMHFNILAYILFIMLDLFLLKREKQKYILIMFAVISIKDLFIFIDFYSIVAIIFVAVYYILLSNISSLYDSKIEAQKLYDKIRTSEIELKKLNSDIERYAQTSLEIAVLRERNRISREVHDSVGHVLSTAMIQLSAMERVSKVSKNPLHEMISELREFVSDSFQEVKMAVRELKPDEYSDYEGMIRIKELCENVEKFSGVNIKLKIIGEIFKFEGRQGVNIYRITQEIFSNTVKHSKANNLDVIFEFEEDSINIVFKDDGIGTDKIVESGVGIKSIRERVKEISGQITFISEKNKGMMIKIALPRNYGGVYGED